MTLRQASLRRQRVVCHLLDLRLLPGPVPQDRTGKFEGNVMAERKLLKVSYGEQILLDELTKFIRGSCHQWIRGQQGQGHCLLWVLPGIRTVVCVLLQVKVQHL